MSNKLVKPLTLAVAVGVAGTFSLGAVASPTFVAKQLVGGYMLAATGDHKGGEGKCGEGKCGVAKMDTNKDGKVSKAEHAAMADQMFDQADANHDGMLTQEEMDAAHKGKEASCGADKKAKEASCGADKKGKEASCGADKKGKEGSCGGQA